MQMLKLLGSSLVTTYRILCSPKKNNFVALLSTMSRKSNESRNIFFRQRSDVSVNLVYLEVIGSGAEGVPSCVMLVTNYGQYLINCGEGTVRLSSEYRRKLHKSPSVFITYPSWKNISGLFGMALAVQESKGTEFHIHSNSDIEDMFLTVNKIVNLRHLQVKVRNCLHNSEFSDGIVSVKSILLYPTSKKERFLFDSVNAAQSKDDSLDENTDFDDLELGVLCKKKEREINLTKKPDKQKRNLPEIIPRERNCMDYAVCYVFKTEHSQGSLNFEKCLEYGVPPGPLLGQLKNGVDVTLDDGRVVRSVDVKEPDLPGVSFIAVECPTEEYLDSLLEEPEFLDFQSEESPVEAIVHFSSSHIIKNSKYQEWINRFPRSTLHLFINEENKRTGSAAIHRQQYKLNLLHPELFPLLDDSGIPEHPRKEDVCIPEGHTKVAKTDNPYINSPIFKDRLYLKCESNRFISGETLCQVQLRPKRDYDYIRNLVLKKELFYNEMFESDEIKEKIEEGKQELKKLQEKIKGEEGSEYPKIVFLGTGSSKPSKVRNGSGILIFVNSSKCILLDCGESTFGQMVNFYGIDRAREVLRNLQAIYVSHMHLDHHMGLITLLKERKAAFDEVSSCEPPSDTSDDDGASSPEAEKNFFPLTVLGPIQMTKWLTLFSATFEDISNLYNLVSNSSLTFKNKSNSNIQECKKRLGLSSITTVHVVHCYNAFGISLIHKNGWKITYSGDTRPCEELIEMGMNSDVLIHEATLENAYASEALVKQHSTTSQAIDVGKKMKAKYIVLTHFSQRYCHLPNIGPECSNSNVGIAFDFMEVPFNKLPLLPALIKPLQYALSKYDEQNKTTTELFLLRKEKNKRAMWGAKELCDEVETPAKISKKNY